MHAFMCVCVRTCTYMSTLTVYKVYGSHDKVAEVSSFVVYYAVLMAKYVVYSPYWKKVLAVYFLWLADMRHTRKNIAIVCWSSVGKVKIGCRSSGKLCYKSTAYYSVTKNALQKFLELFTLSCRKKCRFFHSQAGVQKMVS